MFSDIEIAQAATMKPIREIASSIGIDEKYLELYGNYKKPKYSLRYWVNSRTNPKEVYMMLRQ